MPNMMICDDALVYDDDDAHARYCPQLWTHVTPVVDAANPVSKVNNIARHQDSESTKFPFKSTKLDEIIWPWLAQLEMDKNLSAFEGP